MKLRNNYIKATGLLMIFTVLFACAEAPKKEAKEEKTEEVEETFMETMSDQEEYDDSFILPSPIQIAAIFNRAGLSYESGLTNPTSNLSNYNTKTAKYYNFGVYSADLAYVVLNNKQQEAIDYLNAVKELSEAIGMPSIFGSGELIKSFEKNISNQDTVLSILTTIKSRTDDYLEENGDKSKESIFFAAAWIEGMYLGANSASNSSKITPRIIEQMTILDNIINAVKSQSDASLDVEQLVSGLTKIKTTYEGFKEVKSLNNDDVELDEITLTEEELSTLTTQITELRTQIIKG